MCEAMKDGKRICDEHKTFQFVIRAPLAPIGNIRVELCTPHRLQIQKEHPTWVILMEPPR